MAQIGNAHWFQLLKFDVHALPSSNSSEILDGCSWPEMHSGCAGDLLLPEPAELRGRRAKQGLERTRESLMALVARLQCNIDDRHRTEPQPAGSPLQPQSPDVFFHRLANHPGENAMKVIPRKASQGGEVSERERFVQMILDMRQHGKNPPLIVLQGNRSHRAV